MNPYIVKLSIVDDEATLNVSIWIFVYFLNYVHSVDLEWLFREHRAIVLISSGYKGELVHLFRALVQLSYGILYSYHGRKV